MRIEEHPILGRTEKGKEVSFFYDGKPVTGFEGEPIAAALKAARGDGTPAYEKIRKAQGYFLCHRALHGLCHGGGRQAQCENLCDTL